MFMSMSADASCQGLRSPRDGPLVMDLVRGKTSLRTVSEFLWDCVWVYLCMCLWMCLYVIWLCVWVCVCVCVSARVRASVRMCTFNLIFFSCWHLRSSTTATAPIPITSNVIAVVPTHHTQTQLDPTHADDVRTVLLPSATTFQLGPVVYWFDTKNSVALWAGEVGWEWISGWIGANHFYLRQP